MGKLPRLARRQTFRLTAMVGVAAVAGFAALVVSASRPGDAAFPGANGHIAYAYGEGYSYAGGSIWSANPDGSAPTLLTAGSNDRAPAYSADGGRLAFERENGVAVMNSNGSGVTPLLTGSFESSSKTEWQENYETPQGDHIPVVKISTNTSKWHDFAQPSFTPDGSQLAVVKGIEDGEFKAICGVAKAGSQKCLEYGEPGAYVHYEGGCTCTSQIITINAATGAVTGEVTPVDSEGSYWGPTYSAGGKLAFSKLSWGPSYGSSIFVINSPGGVPVQVTSGPNDYAPDFSPDGSRIVFTRGDRDIGLVGVGGGPLTILPIPGPPGPTSMYVESPVFSPDGARIAFERRVFGPSNTPERGIFTMVTDGTGITKILEGASPDWQPVAVPPPLIPAKANASKGKVKLNKKGKGSVGTIACGSSPCALKVLSAKLKAGKKACAVKTKLAKALDPGETAKVGVKIAGKCLAALKKAGKGSLRVKVRVTDALGTNVLTLKSTVVPGKGRK